MQFQALPTSALDKIRRYDFERFIRKHEGPESWRSFVKYYTLEFLGTEDKTVLLPVDLEQHANITILRTIVSKDEQSLTIFLKDTTHASLPDWEKFEAGFVAICDKVPGEEFFIAILYHQRFIIEEQQLS